MYTSVQCLKMLLKKDLDVTRLDLTTSRLLTSVLDHCAITVHNVLFVFGMHYF